MSHPLYLLLFIFFVVAGIVITIIANHKINSHTELYREGVRNENNGKYLMALQNYEDALGEIRKLNLDKNFGKKITQRIKVLRYFMEYNNL